MDFMVSLPPLKGFDAIMVVVDRFSKMAHFIPTKDSATAQETGRLLTRPQDPCVTPKGSKEFDLRNWIETWCRSQLPALKGVEGSCWKLRD
jgi:hypothetical protein